MPKSRIPSPARSHTGLVTPRRAKPRGPRSVGSPARSNTSMRLTSVIQNFKDKNMESFHLSPLNSRRSVLNDNTDIEEPRRNSWWKKLNDTSRDIMQVLENDKPEDAYNVIEEYMDVEPLSQEKKNHTLDLPDSSDGESISSIIIPQRKLFNQKENQPRNKFSQFVGPRESMATLNKTSRNSDKSEKTIVAGTKKLFGQGSKPRSKPAFPTELLNFSPDKTVNKTAGEIKGQVRNLFGNRGGVKRKNNFADFIASESEDEPEIQPKIFGFQKKTDGPVIRTRDPSPTSSVTTDIDMDDWKLLPSSTMVQTQLEAMITDTPAKKARLSKLSEGKESEAASSIAISNKTKISNKSLTSKNKYKMSMSKTSITSPKGKPNENEVIPENNDENEVNNEGVDMALPNDDGQLDNIAQNNENDVADRTKQSNKSVLLKNKSKMAISKTSINKSNTSPKNKSVNRSHVTEKDILDEEPNEVNDVEPVAESHNLSKSKSNKSKLSSSKTSLNKSKTSPINKDAQKVINEAIPETNYGIRDLDAEVEQNEDTEQIENNGSNKSTHSNKSCTNKSKLSALKSQFNKSKTSPETNKGVQKSIIDEAMPENDEYDMVDDDEDDRLALTYSDEEPNNAEIDHQNIEDDKSKMSNSKVSSNVSKTISTVKPNEKAQKTTVDKALSESGNQEIVLDKEKNKQANASEETHDIEKGQQNLASPNDNQEKDLNEIDSGEAVIDNSQEIDDKAVNKDNAKIINESTNNDDTDINKDDDEEPEEEEDAEVENESQEMEDENQESEQEEIEEEEQNMSQEVESEVEEENHEHENEEENEQSEGVESDVAVETEEDNEPEENDDTDEQNESEEVANQSEDIENESQEIENEENEESEAEEENDGEEEIEKSVNEQHDNNESENENEVNDEETANNVSQEVISGTEEGTPNVTHDTTGRYRKKEETVKSPEAILHNEPNQMESFTARNRNTSIRRTSMIKNLNIRPSLAPPRESTGLSNGTENSSVEGSGWDSHRTTKKTLRKTFGRDFTPRKSLRAMVMEKSAKRHTQFTVNDVGVPEANSTELPGETREVYEEEDPHEVSKRTRQTTLEMYLQKIKKQNMEKRKKLEEEVRNSLQTSTKPSNPFTVPARPFGLKRVTKPAPKPKKTVKSMIPLDDLPQELLDDMMYKPPKRFQPSNASWITKRLYKFLESKLEEKYDYKARIRAEKLVETIYQFAKELRKHSAAPAAAVEVLKHEMARLGVVRTHFDFYQFFHEYMPREVRVKVNPDVVNKIPLPKHGVFADILRGNTVQG